MIDINKKYRTQGGREVRIYATDHAGGRPIQGAFLSERGEWWYCSWTANGRVSHFGDDIDDLIEIKPRIHRTLWIDLYPNEGAWLRHEPGPLGNDCLARKKIEIDVEEGEGL